MALSIGWFGLCWGLVTLHATFALERDRALDAIESRTRAIEAAASLELRDRFEGDSKALRSRLLAPLDPLEARDGIYLRQAGRLILPSLAAPPGTPARAESWLASYRGIATDPSLADASQDLNGIHLARIARALTSDHASDIEGEIRRYLGHRHQRLEAPARAIAADIVVLERLTRDARASRQLLEGWLHLGLSAADGSPFVSLQHRLLRARSELAARDVEQLGDAIVRLCREFDVPHGRFIARLGDELPIEAPQLPWVTAPSLVEHEGASWLLAPASAEPSAEDQLGARIDLPRVSRELAQSLRMRSVLEPDESIDIVARGPMVGLDQLVTRLDSPGKQMRHAAILHNQFVKDSVLACCAFFALGMAGFATLAALRKQRFFRLKSDFVAAVSHELKTPLASVRLLAETLQRRLDGHPRARDYPQRIIDDVDRMTSRVENILSYARLERGRLEVRSEAIDLADLFAGLAADRADWHPAPSEPRLHLDLTIGPDAASLRADPEMLRLALVNLMRNAGQHRDDGSNRLQLRARILGSPARRRGWLEIAVEDDGPGMPSGSSSRMFEAFVVDHSREGQSGTGLGLAICAAIMIAHRGRLEVDSPLGPDGRGTRFRLLFPPSKP